MEELQLSLAREVVAFAALFLMNATIVILARRSLDIAEKYLERKAEQNKILLNILERCVVGEQPQETERY